MKLALDHWHIEPSGICTLKCPRCPRVEGTNQVLNKQLTLDFFQTQIGKDIIKSIRKITFCGDVGDPIYCNDLIPIIQWIKNNSKCSIVLITNGSHKSIKWWEQLAHILDNTDEIHWSLDGWDQVSNEQYRVNCDWDSILDGIHAFTRINKVTYKIWAAIAFSFNQDHLSDMMEKAKGLMFDNFQYTLSTKVGSVYPESYPNDNLEPTKELIPSSQRFERIEYLLTSKKRISTNSDLVFVKRAKQLYNSDQYPALCYVGNKGVFLNSTGEFYPCCWVANPYEHNARFLDMGRTEFNLNNSTMEEILANPFWTTEFLNFDNLECRTKCVKSNLLDPKLLKW